VYCLSVKMFERIGPLFYP